MAVAAIAARWLISISLLSASLSSAALLPSLGQVPDLRRDLGIDLGLDLEPSLVTYTHTYTHTVTSCPSTTSAASQATGYYSPAFIPAGDGLQPALSQSQTNGDSAWGTLNASALPVFLNTSGGVSSHGFPWGSATANNTDQYTYTPNTNVTRKYVFTVSSGTIAPDGVEKSAILINGAFPGPLIEANWGDMIEVEVTNNLTTEGTSMHWYVITKHSGLGRKIAYHGEQAWPSSERHALDGRRSWNADMPYRSRSNVHLSLPSGSLRDNLVPQSLLCTICRWRCRPISRLWS